MKILPVDSACESPAGSLATATIDHITDDGTVMIRFGAAPTIAARIAVPPGSAALVPGASVLVLLEPARDAAPVIVSPIVERIGAVPEVIEIAAGRRVTLRVGDASIELHADGTVEIHGDRIDSHAEGIQRIKGAQVRIN